MYNAFQPIPAVIEDLYPYVVHIPDPEQWPEYLQRNPTKATASTAFTRACAWDSSWRRQGWRRSDQPFSSSGAIRRRQ